MTAKNLLGHVFSDASLKEAALRHSSLPERKGGGEHFERLEFLGDRVVGLVVARMLMEGFPSEAEGLLTRHHTALVRAGALARIAREAGLDTLLQTAQDESRMDTALADALEAVLGAIYLDGGFDAAERVVRRLWQPHLRDNPEDLRDPKTRLQEWAQARGPDLPVYEVLSQTGPAHAPHFVVRASVTSGVTSGVRGGASAEGAGSSKRLAEQQAAQKLLETLNGQTA
jgi:ribonuclease-3